MNIIQLGRRKNILLKYKAILQNFEELQKKYKGAIICRLHKDFIYPKYFISRDTLYRVFNTDIEKELQEIEAQIKQHKERQTP